VADNTISADTNTAEDAQDFQSGGATDLTTETDISVSILNEQNANAVILQAFDVFSGRAYDQRLTSFPYTMAVHDTEIIGDSALRYLSRSCQNNGEMSQAQSSGDDRLVNDSFYTDCQIGGDTLQGRVVLDHADFCCDFQREFRDNFSVSFEPGGVMELSGVYTVFPSLTYLRKVAVDNFNYRFSYSGGALTVSNATTERSIYFSSPPTDEFRARIAGSFSMNPPVLNGALVQVQITEDFVNESVASQLAYERGQMQIISGDATILLNANTGDMQTVELTITRPTAEPVSRIENWSTWADALSYIPQAIQDQKPAQPVTGDGMLINPNSWQTILAEVFAVLTGNRFATDIASLPDYPMPEFPPLFLVQSAPDGFGETVTQQCTNGGSALLTPFKQGFRQITSGWNSEFSDCELDGEIFTGQFFTREFGNIFNGSRGLNIESDSRSRAFSGTIDWKTRSNRDGSPDRHYALSAVNYASTDSADTINLSAANIYFQYVTPFSSRLNGHFSLSSNATSGETISVSIADQFSYRIVGDTTANNPPVTHYQSGQLIVRAGNNNTMWVSAATNDEESFNVTLLQAGQDPVHFVERWQELENRYRAVTQ